MGWLDGETKLSKDPVMCSHACDSDQSNWYAYLFINCITSMTPYQIRTCPAKLLHPKCALLSILTFLHLQLVINQHASAKNV